MGSVHRVRAAVPACCLQPRDERLSVALEPNLVGAGGGIRFVPVAVPVAVPGNGLPQSSISRLQRDGVPASAQLDTAPSGLPFMNLMERFSTRKALITAFLALLELARIRAIKIDQKNAFGDIHVRSNPKYERSQSFSLA